MTWEGLPVHQQYEVLAGGFPVKIVRHVPSVMMKTVKVIADVNLETGEVQVAVRPEDLQKLRKDAKISDQ